MIEYNGKKKRQPIFKFFTSIVRIFTGKKKVVYLGEKPDEHALYLANHANKIGPLIYEMYLPIYCVKWGHHGMFGNYKSRYNYLRNILYIQKNGLGKTRATIKALFEALFSGWVYKGVKVLPTYQDFRLAKTIKKSITAFENDTAIMIFPEDSDKGYKKILTNIHPGFILLLEKQRKETGKEFPIRPVYYHKEKRTILVGEKYYLKELIEKGMNRDEITEFFKDRINELCFKIENNDF